MANVFTVTRVRCRLCPAQRGVELERDPNYRIVGITLPQSWRLVPVREVTDESGTMDGDVLTYRPQCPDHNRVAQ